jgi:hypothetical protein
MDVGINSNGNAVVVLPNTLSVGPGLTVESFGASYTLTGSGSVYHTYQLFFNPTTHVADLAVDGVVRLTDYTGNTSFFFETALNWAAFSGGQSNFTFVRLQTGFVPEPSSVALLLAGVAVVVGYVRSTRSRMSIGCPRGTQ